MPLAKTASQMGVMTCDSLTGGIAFRIPETVATTRGRAEAPTGQTGQDPPHIGSNSLKDYVNSIAVAASPEGAIQQPFVRQASDN